MKAETQRIAEEADTYKKGLSILPVDQLSTILAQRTAAELFEIKLLLRAIVDNGGMKGRRPTEEE